MKRMTLLFATVLIATVAMGQNEKYYQKMGEALGQFAGCTSVEDFQNLANQFGVIAKVETEEWLPLYYEAHCYILMGFTGQLEADVQDSYLDKASASIDKMLDIAPDEAEVYVMKAFYHTGYLVVDPPARAMSTSPLISDALSRALSIESDNPRAQFLSISNEMGTASYFGSDTTPICKKAGQLLDSWDNYAIKSPIHPGWGKEETEGIVRGCGE
jgi:hypothetical protein